MVYLCQGSARLSHQGGPRVASDDINKFHQRVCLFFSQPGAGSTTNMRPKPYNQGRACVSGVSCCCWIPSHAVILKCYAVSVATALAARLLWKYFLSFLFVNWKWHKQQKCDIAPLPFSHLSCVRICVCEKNSHVEKGMCKMLNKPMIQYYGKFEVQFC